MVLNGLVDLRWLSIFLDGSNDLRWVYMVLDGLRWFKIILDPFSSFSGAYLGFSLF